MVDVLKNETDDSDTRRLNRDIDATDTALYNHERSQGDIDVTVDTRLLTEDGHKQIKEDVKRVELAGSAMVDVANHKEVRIQDLVEHVDTLQKDLDVQKLMAQQDDGLNAKILNDPNAKPEQKQQAINAYVSAYASVYDLTINEAKVIVANQLVSGAHISRDGDSSQIYINDTAQENGLDYANVIGHEVTHAQIEQGTITDRGDEQLNEDYAHLRGDYSEENYEFSFSNNDLGTLNTGDTNQHTGNQASALVHENTQSFRENLSANTDNVDYLLPAKVEEWRNALNDYMEKNRSASKELQGDAVGTVLSIAAAPADILADLTDLVISTVDVSTDGIAATGILGGDLKEESRQNLVDLGMDLKQMVDNRDIIAHSIVQTLKEYPERIAEFDPSALRALTGIVGEAAMPAGALAKIKASENVADTATIVSKVDLPDAHSGVVDAHIGAAWDSPTNTKWNPSAKTENCIACVASYITDRLDGKAGQFLSADDVERIYASVDPSRGLQLSEAVEIIHKAAKSDTPPVVKTPFAADAPNGQYALFFGQSKDKLRHVVYAEKLPNSEVRIFDPQNGQIITNDELLSLKLKWGGTQNSPIVPILIRRLKSRGKHMQKKYTCLNCLHESTDKDICTHCGFEIERVSLEEAEFFAPIQGVVVCNIESITQVDEIIAITEDLESKYHDSFEICFLREKIEIKCNDISGARLVSRLEKIGGASKFRVS